MFFLLMLLLLYEGPEVRIILNKISNQLNNNNAVFSDNDIGLSLYGNNNNNNNNIIFIENNKNKQ